MTNIQVCPRCVMDSTAAGFAFVESGCSYCVPFEKRLKVSSGNAQFSLADRTALISGIKQAGKGRRYDCVVGVSGGIDSSYALFLAKKEGLRPLAVHLDNGWNSELAVSNIANLVQRLGIDLHTHVIDWEENKRMQLAFFKADVIDIELLMDNAMWAVVNQAARKWGTKYILSGCNTSTEGMAMPTNWNWYKFDMRNIRAIAKRFGGFPIQTHPLYSTFDFCADRFVRQIGWVNYLDYYEYEKSKAIAELKEEVGFCPYPYKHYESVFTRFYQAHILPKKFGVDKRKLHLGTLVVSGQMLREEAIEQLSLSPYPSADQEAQDRAFVLKKFEMTDEELESYIRRPQVSHESYPSEIGVAKFLRRARAGFLKK